METFLPLVERLGVPVAFLTIAVVAMVRGDVVPKYLYARVLSELERERKETDRWLDMSIRLLEDARDSQHLGREALQEMRRFQSRRNGGRERILEDEEHDNASQHPPRRRER